jgi:2-aminoadipate transaminase
MPSPIHLSARSRRTADQPISYFMQQAVENPGLISLAAGLVDAATLPAEAVADAAAAVLADPALARAALQYGTTPGYAPLRDALLRRAAAADGLTPADLNLTADQVLLTSGSQQLLYLLTEALIDPGDLVITAAPSYFVYHGTLHSHGARTLAVPCDGDGMDTDALAELLARLDRTGEIARLRMIYVVDYFDNPTGATERGSGSWCWRTPRTGNCATTAPTCRASRASTRATSTCCKR